MPHRAAESAEERQGRLAKGLRAVVDIGDELILAPSLDALYRRAVELAREKLGLERCALFVEEGPSVRGTYGTDAQGKTTDERSFSFLKDEKWTRHFSPKPPTAQRWDLRERALEYWDGEKVVRVGYGWVAVTPITGSSGRPVAVLCNDPGTTGAKADPDQQDLVAVFASLLANIIERMRAEERLRRLAMRHGAILNGIPDIVMEVDTNRVYTWANRAGYEFFGHDVIGKEARHYFVDEQETYEKVKPLFEGESATFYVESWQRRKDGQKRLLGWWCRALKDDKGQVIGALSTARDITERKQTEEALRRAKEEWERTFDAVPDLICILDAQHRILRVNRAMAERLGRRPQDCIGATCYACVHGTSAPPEFCPHAKLLQDGQEHAAEVHEERLHGDFTVTTSPIRDSEGRLLGSVHVARDITERKQTEEQIRRIQRMESIGTLASGVAHNFNNILGVILGSAELAKLEVSDASEAHKLLDAITKSTQRAALLAHRMLAITRRESLDKAPLQPSPLTEALAQAMRIMLDSNIQIVWHADDDLPPVIGNQAELEQVLMNICLNARDAMPKGGTLTIEARAVDLPSAFTQAYKHMKPGPHVCISIADTGTGMSPAIQQRIFDPFFTTKEPGAGTGLGLSTAYGAIVAHGGCIDVQSELGKGSAFRIYLPAATGAEAVVSPPEPPPLRTGTETILVVDDEEGILAVARKTLQELGYTVLTAHDGVEAVQVLSQHPKRVHLVLLDYMMPKMDGADAFREIKRLNPKLKVVISSGYDVEGRVMPLLNAGADGFIHKPYRLAELSQRVREVLDKA